MQVAPSVIKPPSAGLADDGDCEWVAQSRCINYRAQAMYGSLLSTQQRLMGEKVLRRGRVKGDEEVRWHLAFMRKSSSAIVRYAATAG